MSSTDTSMNGLLELAKNPSLELLQSFRNNYDMCEGSGFFPPQTLLDVKHSALGFLFLGLDTTSVAGITSDDWISKVIFFYENTSEIQDSEATENVLDKLSGEAKTLSKTFHVIAEWARYLWGQIHQARNNALAASDQFTNEFHSELETAQRQFTDAQLDLQASKYIIGAGLGLATAIAKEKFFEADRNLDAARQLFKKKKAIADAAAVLGKALAYMESVVQEIGVFWTKQAENWIYQGCKMINSEADLPVRILELSMAPEDITFWKELQQQLNKFVEVMTKVRNLYNYPGEASPPGPTTKLHISELNFSMAVPSAVNVDSIMAD